MAASGTAESTDLPAAPVSAGQARRFVRSALAAWAADDLLDEAELLTSEVVTNAVLHTGSSSIHLRIELLPDGVRIEIGDESTVLPHALRYSSQATTGRGLSMVETAARSWGAVPTQGGKTVWFEVGR